MITFKEFLAERALKNWTVKKASVKKAIAFLNAHCKDGLKAIKNDGVLYRGFSGAIDEDSFLIFDSTKSLRTSRDTNNAYQMMMDASPALRGVPSRSNSFICTTSKSTASGYGGSVVMVPLDGTVIAYVPVEDIFNLTIQSKYGRDDVETISSNLGALFLTLGVKSSKGKYINHEEINAIISKSSPELVLLSYLNEFNLGMPQVSKVAPHDIADAFTRLEGGGKSMTIPHINKSIKKLATWMQQNPSKFKVPAPFDTMFKAMKADPTNLFNVISGLVMTRESAKITTVEYGGALPPGKEVWFSGKAMTIPFELFAGILNEISKVGTSSIGKRTELTWQRQMAAAESGVEDEDGYDE